jgi:hypothetical protein
MPISNRVLQDVRESISKISNHQEIVSRVLERLPRFEEARSDPVAIQQAWNDIVGDLATLVQSKSLDQKLFDMLAEEVVTSTVASKEELEEFKKVAGEFLEQMEMGNNDIASIILPDASPRLQEATNTAFTLRALGLNPKRVLPPGKSLLSLFMNQPDERTDAQRKREAMVADVVKKAFWDSVRMRHLTNKALY